MGVVNAFTSASAITVNIDVSASTQRVQVSADGNPKAVRIMNNGTATVWLAWGGSTVTASLTTGVPVGPNVHEVLTMDNQGGTGLYVAAIAAGSTGKVYFTPGDGI